MHGFNGLWKRRATPRSATAGTTLTRRESEAQSNADSHVESNTEADVNEARFGEQLCRLYQSVEEANQRARLNSRGNPGRQMARAAGSGIVRPV